jgi:hypothetical protein
VADLLPRPELRHDFNLFVGALAARLMSIPGDIGPRDLRWAQEDAWADGRVQRRWAQFVVQMSQAESEALLQRLADSGLAGVRVLVHEPASATEGWSLPAQPALVVSPRRARPVARAGSARPAAAAAAQMR